MSMQNGPVPLSVRNPYTGEEDYEIAPPTRDELAGICQELRANQVEWGAAPLEHRIEVMSRWADELAKAHGALAAADSADTGGCLISPIAPGIVTGAVRGWCADAPKVIAEAARSGLSSIMPSISFREGSPSEDYRRRHLGGQRRSRLRRWTSTSRATTRSASASSAAAARTSPCPRPQP